ncbi:MAG: hypothetical protein Q4F31_00860 [Eubacteriales bacterium]|nr:hypothetical protein [Eubacteriales bacterium]
MTILIDMDDVLECLVAGWVKYLNIHFHTDVAPEDVTDWDVSLSFPMLTKEQVYSVETDDSLWDYVKPMPGADEALRKLMDDGHTIYVVTATKYQTLKAKMEKVLFRYFPYLTWNQVIITGNKHMIRGDVLIDDAPHNMTGDFVKLLFDSGHNRNFDEKSVGAIRVHGWQEAYEQICRIAKEKESEKQ